MPAQDPALSCSVHKPVHGLLPVRALWSAGECGLHETAVRSEGLQLMQPVLVQAAAPWSMVQELGRGHRQAQACWAT